MSVCLPHHIFQFPSHILKSIVDPLNLNLIDFFVHEQLCLLAYNGNNLYQKVFFRFHLVVSNTYTKHNQYHVYLSTWNHIYTNMLTRIICQFQNNLSNNIEYASTSNLNETIYYTIYMYHIPVNYMPRIMHILSQQRHMKTICTFMLGGKASS